MPEGLRKIDGSKNYYQYADGSVYHIKEVAPYKKGNQTYYRIYMENGNRVYYSTTVTKTVTDTPKAKQVTKVVTNKTTLPKKKLDKAEIEGLVF